MNNRDWRPASNEATSPSWFGLLVLATLAAWIVISGIVAVIF
jgi:hypothetical protein